MQVFVICFSVKLKSVCVARSRSLDITSSLQFPRKRVYLIFFQPFKLKHTSV